MEFHWKHQFTTPCFVVIFLMISGLSSIASGNQSTIMSNFNIPQGQGYKVKEVKKTVDWFRPMTMFINGIAPAIDDLPIDEIKALTVRPMRNLKDQVMQILKKEAGIIAFLIIGIAFAIVLPIIGLVAACCLCCSSKKVPPVSPSTENSRRWLIFFNIFFLIVILLGILYMFVSATLFYESLYKISKQLNNNLDDAVTFVNNTQMQIQFLTEDRFDETVKEVLKELDDTENKFGNPVVSSFMEKIQLKELQEKLQQIQNAMKDNSNLFDRINEVIKQINRFKTADFDSFLKSPYCQVQYDCSKLNVTEPSNSLNTTDFQTWKETVDPLVAEVFKAKDEFPEKLKKETGGAQKEIKESLQNIQKKFQQMNKEFNNVTKQVSTSTSDVKRGIGSILDTPIYEIVYKALVAVNIVLLISWLLFLFGLLGGTIFYKKKVFPENRGCCSSCSGCLILLGTAIVFMFAFVFWIVTVVLFAIGSHLEVYICNPLYDDTDYAVLTKYIGFATADKDQYFLGRVILGNGSINLQLKNILKHCQDDEAAYKVLHLDILLNFEEKLKAINSVEERMNSTGQLNQISVTDMMIPNSKSLLKNLANSAFLSNTVKFGELDPEKVFNKTAFTSLDDNDPKLKQIIDRYKIINKDLQDIKNDRYLLDMGDTNSIISISNEASKQLNRNLDLLNNHSKAIVEKATDNYVGPALTQLKNYTNTLEYLIKNEIARCKPVWNIYASSRDLLCKKLADPMNGFWFGLGWSMFFSTILILVGVKLSRYFRRMKTKFGHEQQRLYPF